MTPPAPIPRAQAEKHTPGPWRDVPTFPVLVVPLDAESVGELLHKIHEAIVNNIDCGPDSEDLQAYACIAVAEAIGITAKRPRAKPTAKRKAKS